VGALLVYDVTRLKTFESITRWLAVRSMLCYAVSCLSWQQEWQWDRQRGGRAAAATALGSVAAGVAVGGWQWVGGSGWVEGDSSGEGRLHPATEAGCAWHTMGCALGFLLPACPPARVH